MWGFVCFGVGGVVLVDPYAPLEVADCDHFVVGLECAEDVEQDVVAYHHFLEEVDYLRKWEAAKI